jgi:hypothetical protein
LRHREVITEGEANELLDSVLSGLEHVMPADDPAVKKAREIIGLIRA